MADSRDDPELNFRPARHFLRCRNKSESNTARRGGKVRRSFNVLVWEILVHELVSRCVIMKKLDTTHSSVRSNSLVKTVDLSKHKLSVVFLRDALHKIFL